MRCGDNDVEPKTKPNSSSARRDSRSHLSCLLDLKIFNHQAQELLEVPNSVSKRSGGDQLFLRLSFLCTHQLLLAILASGNSTLLAVVTCWQVLLYITLLLCAFLSSYCTGSLAAVVAPAQLAS